MDKKEQTKEQKEVVEVAKRMFGESNIKQPTKDTSKK